jgi:hypothetical protein
MLFGLGGWIEVVMIPFWFLFGASPWSALASVRSLSFLFGKAFHCMRDHNKRNRLDLPMGCFPMGCLPHAGSHDPQALSRHRRGREWASARMRGGPWERLPGQAMGLDPVGLCLIHFDSVGLGLIQLDPVGLEWRVSAGIACGRSMCPLPSHG